MVGCCGRHVLRQVAPRGLRQVALVHALTHRDAVAEIRRSHPLFRIRFDNTKSSLHVQTKVVYKRAKLLRATSKICGRKVNTLKIEDRFSRISCISVPLSAFAALAGRRWSAIPTPSKISRMELKSFEKSSVALVPTKRESDFFSETHPRPSLFTSWRISAEFLGCGTFVLLKHTCQFQI